MKKLFFLIAILACVISCQAQTFQVYAVKGDVRCFDGQKGSLVTVGMLLGANTKLTIPNGGRIVFFNEVDKRLYTIKNASSGLIANLLMKDDVLVQQLTDSYLSYGGFYLFTFQSSKQTEPINLPDNRSIIISRFLASA